MFCSNFFRYVTNVRSELEVKMKNFVLVGLIIALLIFIIIGYGLFTNSKEETTAGGDQSLGKLMLEMEESAARDRNQIMHGIQKGLVAESEVRAKIEGSLSYLETNLNKMSMEGDEYLELLYHSAFLLAFSDGSMSKMTETEDLISKHKISILAKRAHTYIVDQKQDDSLATQITEDINRLKISSINEFLVLIMDKVNDGMTSKYFYRNMQGYSNFTLISHILIDQHDMYTIFKSAGSGDHRVTAQGLPQAVGTLSG